VQHISGISWVNLPFVRSAIRGLRSNRCDPTLGLAEREVLQLFVSSEAPTRLNSNRHEKLREDDWLISTILLEINQLEAEWCNVT
jgi:hypothetical protein